MITKWSQEEDEIILKAINDYSSKAEAIEAASQLLTGRTLSAITGRWYLLRKRLKETGSTSMMCFTSTPQPTAKVEVQKKKSLLQRVAEFFRK